MKATTVLFLLLISLALTAAEDDRVVVGKVMHASKDRIDLDRIGDTLSIGFVGDADALRSLEKIKVGSEVRAVFGVAPGPDGRPINKLVSIRVCTQEDTECEAGRKRQDEEREEWAERHAKAEQKGARCKQAMLATLATDSRYLPETSAPVSKDYLARHNALTGKKSVCARQLLTLHEKAFFEACEQAGRPWPKKAPWTTGGDGYDVDERRKSYTGYSARAMRAAAELPNP